MATRDLAQASSDAIAHDCAPDLSRCNDAGAENVRLLHGENGERQQISAKGAA
jgi:hypothetical protein